MVKDALAGGTLIRVLADWEIEPLPVWIMYPQNRHLSAKVRVFVEWIAGPLQCERPNADEARRRGTTRPRDGVRRPPASSLSSTAPGGLRRRSGRDLRPDLPGVLESLAAIRFRLQSIAIGDDRQRRQPIHRNAIYVFARKKPRCCADAVVTWLEREPIVSAANATAASVRMPATVAFARDVVMGAPPCRSVIRPAYRSASWRGRSSRSGAPMSFSM